MKDQNESYLNTTKNGVIKGDTNMWVSLSYKKTNMINKIKKDHNFMS